MRQFPRGCGKAYDTALLCKWLDAELNGPNDILEGMATGITLHDLNSDGFKLAQIIAINDT